jgi:hypothetical protein
MMREGGIAGERGERSQTLAAYSIWSLGAVIHRQQQQQQMEGSVFLCLCCPNPASFISHCFFYLLSSLSGSCFGILTFLVWFFRFLSYFAFVSSGSGCLLGRPAKGPLAGREMMERRRKTG